jgi:histidine ammonia-lyase
MPVTLRDSQDLDLRAYRRIAWDGEGVELDPGALERIAEQRAAFEVFVAANEGERLYGVTTAHHRGASTLLSPSARVAYARRVPPVPATFGPSLPERLVRGIVAARVAGFIGGGSAVRPELALAVAAMLAGPMPRVPARGHGDPGEIIALGATFAHLEDVVALEAKEGMALVNGAPCAAAALADAALGARGRLAVLEEAFALALEAVRAPHAHLDPVLDASWRDPHETAALRSLRTLLEDGAAERRSHQVAVAFRDAPRLLGWFRRVLQQAEECAAISLSAPGDNPTFAPDDADASARLLSNAGYHDPRAAPALNALAASFADLASLAAVQATRLAEDPDGLAAGEDVPYVTLLSMTALGWAEEARVAAAPTLISLGGSAPSDTSSPALLAWRLAEDVATCLHAVLACLDVLTSHTIHASGRRPPPRLRHRFDEVIAAFPIGSQPRDWGAGLELVARAIERQVRESR